MVIQCQVNKILRLKSNLLKYWFEIQTKDDKQKREDDASEHQRDDDDDDEDEDEQKMQRHLAPRFTQRNLLRIYPKGTRVTSSNYNPFLDWVHRAQMVAFNMQGGTLEGLIPSSNVAKYKDQVKGLVYRIERFDVIKAREKYRAVDHPWRLCFTQRTVVEPIVPQPEKCPILGCTLLPFSQLENRIKENVVISDVVGLVTSHTEVLPPSGGAREQRRQVYISDGRQRAVVTLWGNMADAFDGARLLEWSKGEPIMAIFVATLVDQYSGMLAFKSTTATGWYINVEAPEVSAILERVYAVQLGERFGSFYLVVFMSRTPLMSTRRLGGLEAWKL